MTYRSFEYEGRQESRRTKKKNLFFKIFANGIVDCDSLLQAKVILVIQIIICGGWWREEIEEGVYWSGFTYKPCTVGIWWKKKKVSNGMNEEKHVEKALLFLCFLISNSFVKSLSSFHWIVVPIEWS